MQILRVHSGLLYRKIIYFGSRRVITTCSLFPISGALCHNKSCTLRLCFQSLLSVKRREMSSSTRPSGAGEESAIAKQNSSTWMDSVCSPRTQSVWMSYFLDRLAAPLLCLTICVAAQPNPIRCSSFPILLSMRWHFYPPIKTFKGPLSKRKECCFNSVVVPCLGPFFSVCNQPTLASRLMFSGEGQAKRGPSPPLRRMTEAQHGPWALFSPLQALRADYKLLACLLLLQPHCFSLSATWFSGLTELARLCWRTSGLLGSFVLRSQESGSLDGAPMIVFSSLAQLPMSC